MPEPGTLPVIALAPEVVVDRAIAADLVRVAVARQCETGDELLDLTLKRQVDAAVIGLRDRAGPGVGQFIAKLRRRDPGLRIVVDMPATRTAFQQIPAVLQAGASEVAIRGFDRLSEVIGTVVAPDWQPGAERALLDVVPAMVPETLEVFGVACALKGSPRLTVELAAEWVETSPRTIRSRLRRAALAPPLAFVRYCSAARAMCLLHPQRLPPSRVVERMRFGSRRALHDLIQDYAGDSTALVHERWSYAALLLRAGEFLRRPPVRRTSNIGIDLEQLERYANNDLTTEERVELERRIAATALTEAGEALDHVRRWSEVRGLGRNLRQRREETWARLLRSIGPTL
ncbi:MAG: hypothetical protein H0T50_10585 [Gemmatimonadales bacterium]|nr:hypothetical protein [Gemmatimonadales bacterium]